MTTAIFYGQALVYMVLTIRMINKYQTKAKQTLSSYNPDIFKWLWSFMLFMILLWVLNGLHVVVSISPIVNNLAYFLLVVFIYLIAIVHWRNPSLFHIEQLEEQLVQPASHRSKQLSNGLLDQELRSSILSLVQDQVKEEALYRNSELTLTTLSEKVGVSVHHLSETLNQHGGKNFNLFINEYRVAEVCQQLDQRSERKLIDLAMDAGFSSKSSFNAIFKKLTGQTPSQYKRQLTSQ
ncbi:MAG: helix-turn-helix domain-containing protein [Proteobacteria bacterium]|nr:helix-turn-helix domain-containing protein [Pseudomonadota bacterium]